MALWIAENEARGFGENHGIGVALARGTQIKLLGMEGDMHILRDVCRIYDKSVVLVAALVEYLGGDEVELPEVGENLAGHYTPLHVRVAHVYRLVEVEV